MSTGPDIHHIILGSEGTLIQCVMYSLMSQILIFQLKANIGFI